MNVEFKGLDDENLSEASIWNHPLSDCLYCIYWESPDDHQARLKTKEETLRMKRKWVHATLSLFGNCIKIAYVDGKAVGYAQFAPPELLPQVINYPSGPPDSGAIFISCLTIDKRFRGLGLGSHLLHNVLSELKERGIKAVETFARSGNRENPSGHVEFYLRNGFQVIHEDEEFPLMRLEL